MTAWYENGQKRTEINYKNGKKEELQTRWHENGQKRSEANWKNGKKDGIGQYTYPDKTTYNGSWKERLMEW